jgi:YggT family protein
LFFDQCLPDATIGAKTICLLFNFLTFAIFIRAILSWFSVDRSNPLIQALDAVTEPIIDPIRRVLPRIAMLDFSPFVAMILLIFTSPIIQSFLIDQGI